MLVLAWLEKLKINIHIDLEFVVTRLINQSEFKRDFPLKFNIVKNLMDPMFNGILRIE